LIAGHLDPRRDESRLHNRVVSRLVRLLCRSAAESAFEIGSGRTRLITKSGDYLIPDVVVLNDAVLDELRGSERLEAYTVPVPLVAEILAVSSDATVLRRVEAYRLRGDAFIMLVDVAVGVLRTWNRQPDGNYLEAHHTHGSVLIPSLPGVSVDFDALFA
jgi:Uma2 family endonuclease